MSDNMMKAPRVTDTTLRDGSHAMRHQFTKEQVRSIVQALDGAGVPDYRSVVAFFARQLGTFATETEPSECSVAVMTSTGVSSLCVPGWILPR